LRHADGCRPGGQRPRAADNARHQLAACFILRQLSPHQADVVQADNGRDGAFQRGRNLRRSAVGEYRLARQRELHQLGVEGLFHHGRAAIRGDRHMIRRKHQIAESRLAQIAEHRIGLCLAWRVAIEELLRRQHLAKRGAAGPAHLRHEGIQLGLVARAKPDRNVHRSAGQQRRNARNALQRRCLGGGIGPGGSMSCCRSKQGTDAASGG